MVHYGNKVITLGVTSFYGFLLYNKCPLPYLSKRVILYATPLPIELYCIFVMYVYYLLQHCTIAHLYLLCVGDNTSRSTCIITH